MISLKTYALETKIMSSGFIKSIYIFDIFYHFYQLELRISEVWKRKIVCALGVNVFSRFLGQENLSIPIKFFMMSHKLWLLFTFYDAFFQS